MVKQSKWTKALGTVGKVISVLPDTTEIIGRAIDNTRPIVEKELDRHNDRKSAYRDLDNVIHLDVNDAKQHLVERGFIVREILVTAHAKYATTPVNQVIDMQPRSKKVKEGALVKLYYLDQATLNASTILAHQREEKVEELSQKIAATISGVKTAFKKEQAKRKDVTPK